MSDTAVLRRFNRTYTPRIGVLESSFMGSGLSLAAARLLFEIGPQGAAVADLRQRLGLDSGYCSRLLKELQRAHLVHVSPDPLDGRRRWAGLTPDGLRRWEHLDQQSEATAARLLDPLAPKQRAELTRALETAELLVRASGVTVREIDPGSNEAVSAMRSYFAELDRRFPNGFDPGGALDDDLAALRPPDGAFFVALAVDGAVAGCGGLQRHDPVTAEIKRMWVAASWRGVGLGRRLLGELEAGAAELGCERVVLDTNAVLEEAIAMYTSAGYEAIERYNDNPYAQRWFAKVLPRIAR